MNDAENLAKLIRHLPPHTCQEFITSQISIEFPELDRKSSLTMQRQAAAIKYMVEQANKGKWELPAAEILGSVYGTQNLGRSRRMQDLFKSNSQWRDYITNHEKGIWGFIT